MCATMNGLRYTGQTNSSAGDSIGAMLSATWLETIVISTMNAISTTLLVIPLGIVGGMVILDEWVGAYLCIPSCNCSHLICGRDLFDLHFLICNCCVA